MALITNELYSESTRGPLPRIQPDQGPGAVVQRTFAQGGSARTLPIGTPLYVHMTTGHLHVLAPAGGAYGSETAAEVLHSIVYPSEVRISNTGETIGTVMLKGMIHVDELLALRTAGEIAGTEANLLLALRNPKVRNGGLYIEGLTQAK